MEAIQYASKAKKETPTKQKPDEVEDEFADFPQTQTETTTTTTSSIKTEPTTDPNNNPAVKLEVKKEKKAKITIKHKIVYPRELVDLTHATIGGKLGTNNQSDVFDLTSDDIGVIDSNYNFDDESDDEENVAEQHEDSEDSEDEEDSDDDDSGEDSG